jgi:hypothetical protein
MGKLVNGSVEWSSINIKDPNPGKAFTVGLDGKNYYAKTIQLPSDGTYRLRANEPLTAYSYGFTNYDSYGFPASGSFIDPGTIAKDTMPPDPKWTMCCDGSVNCEKTTTVKDMPDDDAIRSNLGNIYMNTNLSFNYKAYVTDFIPGQSKETTWYLDVIDKEKNARAVMTFEDIAGNDTTITINYYPQTQLSITPNFVNFGNLQKDSVSIQDMILKNESDYIPALVELLVFKDGIQYFKMTDMQDHDIVLPITLQPKESMPFKLKFAALVGGNFRDSIGVGNSCIFNYKVHVQATGDFVGIDDGQEEDNTLNIFPNPSDGNAVITFKSLGNTRESLTLYNTLGNMIELPMNSTNRIELKAYNLASGIYHLVMRSGTSIFARKIIIQR